MTDDESRALLSNFIESQKIRISLPLILHRQNNSLQGILAGLRVLLRRNNEFENKQLLEEIYSEAEKAAEYSTRLVEAFAIDIDHMESVNLPDLISDVCVFIHDRYAFIPSIHLDIHDHAIVRGNRSHLFHLLTHLLDNAVDSLTDQNDPIEISLVERTDYPGFDGVRVACLQIIDHGRGIESVDAKEFVQPLTTTKGKHRGLGLTFVSTIIEQHRGRMFIESTPEKGTTVTCLIPCEGEAP